MERRGHLGQSQLPRIGGYPVVWVKDLWEEPCGRD